ncbi:MAG: MATE family efflux transporter [Ignavibacteriae bacterium]|nr:MAG: MATE family efflux transporter [Ignavibacteriota bacterium]
MNKKILNLAIPNIISNITVPLLSSVDTAVMGHLESPVYLGAIALGSMIFNFIYWGFGFLRMGTTGLSAQFYGAKDTAEVSATLFRALFISLSFGIFIVLLQYPIAELSFFLVDGSSEVENSALGYFYIRIFAAPATLSLYALNGWFLGVQNAKFPLYIAVFINILNILLNLLFVYQFDMNVDGVAFGTLISQYLGFILAFFLIYIRYKEYLHKFNFEKIVNTKKIKRFFQVNFDIFLRTLLLIFTLSFFTAKSAEINDTILAANFILMQLWLMISYGVDGFAFAAESLVGKYTGAKDNKKLKKTIKYSFSWGILLGMFVSIIYLVFGREIISLYTNQIKVINAAMIFILWIVVSPIINSISFIWDGIYFGATETRKMLYAMIISVLFFFLPIYYLTAEPLGNHSIWFSLTAFMFIRGATLTWYWKKEIGNNKK